MVRFIVVLAKARTHYPDIEFVKPQGLAGERAAQLLVLHSRQPHHSTLYIGITDEIRARIAPDRGSQFVKKYAVFRLVLVEQFATWAGGDRAREAAEVLEP